MKQLLAILLAFAIGTPPTLFGAMIKNGKFLTFVAGANIQPGALLIISGDSSQPITLSNRLASAHVQRPAPDPISTTVDG
mgnify:CR=1 FL=1